MKKSFYCSGKAVSLLNFFETNKIKNYPVEFFIYDGDDKETIIKLKSLDENIPVYQFHKDNEHRNVSFSFSRDLSNYILMLCQKHGVNYLFCLGATILKGKLLEVYKNRIINIHPSLLPSFKGLKAIDQALATNVQILGITAHFIDNGIDTGPIIMQAVIARTEFRDYNSVLKFVEPMIKKIFYFIDNHLLVTNEENSVVSFNMDKKELLLTQNNFK